MNTFDSWATTFANPSTDIEFTVTGEFKQKDKNTRIYKCS